MVIQAVSKNFLEEEFQIYVTYKGKGKVILLQARCGPEGG